MSQRYNTYEVGGRSVSQSKSYRSCVTVNAERVEGNIEQTDLHA